MTKPDFYTMPRPELRAYVLEHREDDEAIEALIKRVNPNSPRHPYPRTEEDLQEMGKLLQRKLDSMGSGS